MPSRVAVRAHAPVRGFRSVPPAAAGSRADDLPVPVPHLVPLGHDGEGQPAAHDTGADHDRMIGEGLVAFATVFVSTKAPRAAPFVTASTAAASDSG